MTIATKEAIKLMEDIASNDKIMVTIEGSIIGGFVVGATTTAASMYFGPPGIAIGGAAGGLAAAAAMKDKFLPLTEVIAGMSKTEKQALANRIESIMKSLGYTDFLIFTVAVLSKSPAVREKFIQAVLSYIKQEVQIKSS